MKLNLKHIDRTYWILFIALIIFAIISLFSASSSLAHENTSILNPILQQIGFIIVGVGAAFGIQFVDSRYIRFGGYIIYGISLLFVIACFLHLPGSVTINGATRWFRLAGIQFQPSELAKLGLVIVVADQLSRIKDETDKRKRFYITLGITVVTVLPIASGNMSTAILICLVVLLLWILARIPWKYVGGAAAAALVAGLLFYVIVEFAFIRPGVQIRGPFNRAITQVGRIDRKIKEMRQPTAEYRVNDDNYQSTMAKVAVARGGKTPLGVFPGNSLERDYLPLAFADYIFAIIVEESGMIGAIILIFLYMAILFRACYTSTKFADYAAMLMVMGLALMITTQAFISMAVAVGLGPVTGQPLPMISRGGTSVFITSIYFGIMMCVSREQNESQADFEASREDSFRDVPTLNTEDEQFS